MAATASSPFHEGRALRRARQRRHLTLDDAAEATRIPRRFLEALEREAPVDSFPAPVYARAFLREYARYVGLEPEPLVDAFTSRNPAPEPELVAVPTTVVAPLRRWPGRVLAALSAGAVIALAVARLGASGPTPEASKPPRAVRTQAAVAAVAAVAAGPTKPIDLRSITVPPAHHGIDVVLRMTGRCWITATGDGKVVFAPRTLAAGQTVTISARHTLTIRLGNAAGVRITVNGRPMRAGGPGQVVSLSFAWRNGRVVTQ
jgi:transcriptional regulator with XRE-family HTH domain